MSSATSVAESATNPPKMSEENRVRDLVS